MISYINQLLQNKSPLKIGCINSSSDIVEDNLLKIIKPLFGEEWQKSTSKLNQQLQIEEVLNEPDNESIRFLIWSPAKDAGVFTVFINNFSDGWITILNEYAQKFNTKITLATFSNEHDDFPYFGFYYREGSRFRNIHLMREKRKWEFYMDGNPLPFEELERYKKSKPINRIDNILVEKYMKSSGFDCAKESFWYPDTYTVEYKFLLSS